MHEKLIQDITKFMVKDLIPEINIVRPPIIWNLDKEGVKFNNIKVGDFLQFTLKSKFYRNKFGDIMKVKVTDIEPSNRLIATDNEENELWWSPNKLEDYWKYDRNNMVINEITINNPTKLFTFKASMTYGNGEYWGTLYYNNRVIDANTRAWINNTNGGKDHVMVNTPDMRLLNQLDKCEHIAANLCELPLKYVNVILDEITINKPITIHNLNKKGIKLENIKVGDVIEFDVFSPQKETIRQKVFKIYDTPTQAGTILISQDLDDYGEIRNKEQYDYWSKYDLEKFYLKQRFDESHEFGTHLFGGEKTGAAIKWYPEEVEPDTKEEKELFDVIQKYVTSEYHEMNLDNLLPLLRDLKKEYPDIIEPKLAPDKYIYRGTSINKEKLAEIDDKDKSHLYEQGHIIKGVEYKSRKNIQSWSLSYYSAAGFAAAGAESDLNKRAVVMRAKASNAELFMNPKFIDKINNQIEEEVFCATNPIMVDMLVIDEFDEENYFSNKKKPSGEIDEIIVNNPISNATPKIWEIIRQIEKEKDIEKIITLLGQIIRLLIPLWELYYPDNKDIEEVSKSRGIYNGDFYDKNIKLVDEDDNNIALYIVRAAAYYNGIQYRIKDIERFKDSCQEVINWSLNAYKQYYEKNYNPYSGKLWDGNILKEIIIRKPFTNPAPKINELFKKIDALELTEQNLDTIQDLSIQIMEALIPMWKYYYPDNNCIEDTIALAKNRSYNVTLMQKGWEPAQADDNKIARWLIGIVLDLSSVCNTTITYFEGDKGSIERRLKDAKKYYQKTIGLFYNKDYNWWDDKIDLSESKREDFKTFIKYIDELLDYCCKDLGITRPKVKIINNKKYSQENKSFGGYQPGQGQIYLVIKNRNLSDVCRTLAHEVKHYEQDIKGILTPESGKDGSEHENECNAYSGRIMREFNKQHPEILTILNEIKVNNPNEIKFPIKVNSKEEFRIINKKLLSQEYEWTWPSEPIIFPFYIHKNGGYIYGSYSEKFLSEITVNRPSKTWDFTRYIPKLNTEEISINDKIKTKTQEIIVKEIYINDGGDRVFRDENRLKGYSERNLHDLNTKNYYQDLDEIKVNNPTITPEKLRDLIDKAIGEDHPLWTRISAIIRDHVGGFEKYNFDEWLEKASKESISKLYNKIEPIINKKNIEIDEITINSPIPNNLPKLLALKDELEKKPGEKTLRLEIAIKMVECALPIWLNKYPGDNRVKETLESLKKEKKNRAAYDAYTEHKSIDNVALATANIDYMLNQTFIDKKEIIDYVYNLIEREIKKYFSLNEITINKPPIFKPGGKYYLLDTNIQILLSSEPKQFFQIDAKGIRMYWVTKDSDGAIGYWVPEEYIRTEPAHPIMTVPLSEIIVNSPNKWNKIEKFKKFFKPEEWVKIINNIEKRKTEYGEDFDVIIDYLAGTKNADAFLHAAFDWAQNNEQKYWVEISNRLINNILEIIINDPTNKYPEIAKWKKYFTPKQWREIEDNIEKLYLGLKLENHIKFLINKDNPSDFIISAFSWDMTNQGDKYWRNIYDKLRRIYEIKVNNPTKKIEFPLYINNKEEFEKIAPILTKKGYEWRQNKSLIDFSPYDHINDLQDITLFNREHNFLSWTPGILTENNDNDYEIFCDLDGVLTNFDERFKQYARVSPKEYLAKHGDKEFWSFITKIGEKFWSEMPWMFEGKQFWEYISKYNPKILSSPSRDASSRIGKKRWMEKNLPNIELILSNNKQNYSGFNKILIDDREDNIYKWKANGGIGILFKNNEQTMEDLKKLGLYE